MFEGALTLVRKELAQRQSLAGGGSSAEITQDGGIKHAVVPIGQALIGRSPSSGAT